MQVIDVEQLKRAVKDQGLTQVELARTSGVSRATIAKLFKDNGKAPRVHAGTAERLADALGLTVKALDKNDIETSYLREVSKQHEFLDFTGLGIVNAGDQIAMRDGFVSVKLERVADVDRECHGYRAGSDVVKTADKLKKPPAFSLEAALRQSPKFFLLAEPGAGKTTALRYLAGTHASSPKPKPTPDGDRSIPIFIRLAECAEQFKNDKESNLIHAALAQMDVDDAPATEQWLRGKAREGRVLLLLDGLDEVGDAEQQGDVIEAIRAFIRKNRKIQIIITSRPVGFERPNLGITVETFKIQRLDDEAVEKFVDQWCSLRHGHDPSRKCVPCDERASRLNQAIVTHPRIKTLAGNPMMLTVLCLLHDAGAALPQRRFVLYQKLIETFLFTWEQHKWATVAGSMERSLDLDEREVSWLLESIAFDMQTHNWTLVPHWWLQEKTTKFLRDELNVEPEQSASIAGSLLRALRERSGVLVERGPERYGFRHLAFQEYLAARSILSHDDPIATLRPYVYHPRWREVVRLVAGGLDRRHAPQLLRCVLDDPDPTGRFLHRGLLIALGCLADGAAIPDGALLNDIQERIVAVGGSKWLGITMDSFALLGELTSTRLEEFSMAAYTGAMRRAEDSLEKSNVLILILSGLQSGLVRLPSESSKSEDNEDDGTGAQSASRVSTPSLLLTISLLKQDLKRAKELLEEIKTDASAVDRSVRISKLGRSARSDRKARAALLKEFGIEKDASGRVEIVSALRASTSDKRIKSKLISLLNDSNEDSRVRGECARALRSTAIEDTKVRDMLVSYLDRDQPDAIRAGAVSGLARCLGESRELRDSLFNMLGDESEPVRVRVACAHALESSLPSIAGGVDFLAAVLARGSNDLLSRVSAQVLAEYAATDRFPWTKLPIEKIEQVLVGVDKPCQHALEALRSLVDTREVRGLGVSREQRLARALESYGEQIETVFVFGSSARDEQGAESDIDLMVIGDITLKELAPGLKRAEAELGRQINATLYTRENWEHHVDVGTEFVKRVRRDKKVFVKGTEDDLATMAR